FIEKSKLLLLQKMPRLFEFIEKKALQDLEDFLFQRIAQLLIYIIDHEMALNEIEFQASRINNLNKLIKKYPLVEEKLDFYKEFWIQSIIELLERFEQDKNEINELFFKDKNIGKICNIEMGISDLHQLGRSVCILIF